MAFTGNLKEFELPEIFQLLQQQEKTGFFRLLGPGDEVRGTIAFSKGAIIGATLGDRAVNTYLINYVRTAKKASPAEIRELIDAFSRRHTQALFTELVDRRYLLYEEAVVLVKNTIEDLICDMFRTTEGNFRFDADTSVDAYSIEGIVFSPEAISMEAMRRIDEWERIRRYFDERSIFRLADDNFSEAVARDTRRLPVLKLQDPVRALVPCINGKASVAEIIERCPYFFPYRIYETIFEMLSANIIVPAGRIISLGKKGKKRSPSRDTGQPIRVTMAMLAASIAVFLTFFLGCIILGRLVNREKTLLSKQRIESFHRQIAERKTAVARLQYRAYSGTAAGSPSRLNETGLLLQRDVRATGGRPERYRR